MNVAEPNWEKIAAIGQVAGAIATFLAVVVSLLIAFYGRRPRLRLAVGERHIYENGEKHKELLMFEVANAGERPVHIRGFGWRTGWLSWGPKCTSRQPAVQIFGGVGLGAEPPFEIQPGAATASYADMANVAEYCRQRQKSPLFTRDWPILGRRMTRTRAYAYTADGYTIVVKPERALLQKLASAEKDALAR